jgi:3-hydroxyisobutyrate dehydrogenase
MITNMKVAFIGVGTMGKPMAANLVKAGHELYLFDSVPARTAQVAGEIGAQPLRRIGDAGAAEVIVTMLPDARAVRDVALGSGAIETTAKRGTILVDMSSSQPLITRETGAALAAKGIVLIDAPVSGGVQRAVQGSLTIMIGGDDASAIQKVKPVLAAMGSTFFEVGKLGSGHAAKALNNVVGASNYAVLAEALIVADRYGIDQKMLVDIVSASTGQSFVSSVVMKQFVMPKTYSTGFKVGLISKDATIAAELSMQLGCDTPFIQLADKRWVEARDALGEAEDHSKAILTWT